MRKLSEYQGEDAIDLLAEIIEPAAAILADPEFRGLITGNQTTMKTVAYILKHHKHEIVTIMAAIEGVPVEEYKCNVLTLPKMILNFINDPDLSDFFSEQLQTNG